MKDSRIRSVAKGLTWRVIATTTTMALVYWVTGSVEVTAQAGVADVIIKLLFYYGHERAWGKVAWGRVMVHVQSR